MVLLSLEVKTLLSIMGVTITLSGLLTGIFLIIYFLLHARVLLPFRNGYQEGEAEIVRFTESWDDDSWMGEPTRNPVLRYHNVYQQKIVEEEIWNSGIYSPEKRRLTSEQRQRTAEVGTIVAVQYTKNVVRVVDKRFVSEKKYDIKNYVRPMVMCFWYVEIGVILLIMGIFT